MLSKSRNIYLDVTAPRPLPRPRPRDDSELDELPRPMIVKIFHLKSKNVQMLHVFYLPLPLPRPRFGGGSVGGFIKLLVD